MTLRLRTPILLLALALGPPQAHAEGTISQTFMGSLGSTALTGGTVTLAASGAQAAGFAMAAAGFNIIESGFLRFFATETSTATTSHRVTYSLAASQVSVDIPTGACPVDTGVSMRPPAVVPSASEQIDVLKGTAVEVLACPQPSRPVVLTYENFNMTGVDAKTLTVAVYNETSGQWVPLDASIDVGNGTVVATVNHLTIFALVQSAPSTSIGAAMVYPNPYRPSRGDVGMTFINLPAECRLRVYTLRGELVRDLAANAAGRAFWDGKNKFGAAVASGVYFVFLQGAGESKTIKVAVQR